MLCDVDMLLLLQNLEVGFESDWQNARNTYDKVREDRGSKNTLLAKIAEGWVRVVWDRVKVPARIGTSRALRKQDRALLQVIDARFTIRYQIPMNSGLEGDLLEIGKTLEAGEIEFRQLSCPTPSWVAARLWERALAIGDDVAALRNWVDKWNLLGAPRLTPALMFTGDAGHRFRRAALQVIATETSLEDWDRTFARVCRETACTYARDLEQVESYLHPPPPTLLNRALWLDSPSICESIYDSQDACRDVLALVEILLLDIEAQSISFGLNESAINLFDLALSRPDVLFSIKTSIWSRPRLIADLLMHPPTSIFACLIIAKWETSRSAYDTKIVDYDNKMAKCAAFTDGMSVLGWWLEKRLFPAGSALPLLAWLHNSAGPGCIDDLVHQELIRLAAVEVLRPLDPGLLETMVDAFGEEEDTSRPLSGRFAATLEIISISNLWDRIRPETIVDYYVRVIASDNVSLSAQRIGNNGAIALLRMAQSLPASFERFLYPINVEQKISDAEKLGKNPYIAAEDIARSLRCHIRVLSRAVVGCGKSVPDDLVTALTSAVWFGALDHKEKGRVAAFSPRYEASPLGRPLDRPIATDLAAALRTISSEQREKLLSAILETDEPMMLAQLLSTIPGDSRSAITRRLKRLPPTMAGRTLSLTELQSRIDELLSAGALEAAEWFIAEEAKVQTAGEVHGREVMRLRSKLRLLFARQAWPEIMAMGVPPALSTREEHDAEEVLSFFKGLTALTRRDERDELRAESIFRSLHLRKPNVPAYAINEIAANIAILLRQDAFGRVAGLAVNRAREVSLKAQELLSSGMGLTTANRQLLQLHQAIAMLSLDEPETALALLPASPGPHLEEPVQAYRAVALARLGRPAEAVALLRAAKETLGDTVLLEAASAQIRTGASYVGDTGIYSSDDQIVRMRGALAEFRELDPMQQAAVISLSVNPFLAFVVEQVRGAAASVVSLVPMMRRLTLDRCEDDITCLVRELLLSRLDFINWSSADQSKGGFTERGNPGERDLLITRGTTILAVIEAVVCRRPLHWSTVQANLLSHLSRLFNYSTCRLFFYLAYVQDQDMRPVLAELKKIATGYSPPEVSFLNLADIDVTDSRPSGFIAHYKDGDGEIKVVFLALNLGHKRKKNRIAAGDVTENNGFNLD